MYIHYGRMGQAVSEIRYFLQIVVIIHINIKCEPGENHDFFVRGFCTFLITGLGFIEVRASSSQERGLIFGYYFSFFAFTKNAVGR